MGEVREGDGEKVGRREERTGLYDLISSQHECDVWMSYMRAVVELISEANFLKNMKIWVSSSPLAPLLLLLLLLPTLFFSVIPSPCSPSLFL